LHLWQCIRYFHTLEIVKAEDVVLALGALAQESRLAIYRLLVKRGPDGYSPTDLAESIGIPAPTLSFHLKELQRAGLIGSRREGRFLYYSANYERMRGLIGFLTEKCCSLSDTECDSACVPTPAARARRA
jgi:ArsR family transcriptional regulator, arsenate/arsenite/antimonite-responsive transcriptional repressor